MTMNADKQELLGWIERDSDLLIDFLSQFVQAKSPNPPGDTREAMAHIRKTLDGESFDYRIIDPKPEFPNLVASFEGATPGKHLVLNGHIDVFPVADHETWDHGAWSGAVVEGKIWGRGSADMKCGTTSSIFTYIYLHRMKERLKGKLTLTAVSDEETFGPWGARYLMEHHPEVQGDCCLNAEPSSAFSIRFGEKGPLWLKFTVRTAGAHGAYTHLTESATKVGARLIGDLDALETMDSPAPGNVGAALERGREAIEKAQGAGASAIVQKVTVNIGTMRGGVKVNTIPSECVIEADIRIPVGLDKNRVMQEIEKILADYPQVRVEELVFNPPAWCDPDHEMMTILQDNVEALGGERPQPICSLGGTDARLWRYRDIPAFVYGPSPTGMGTGNEHVEIEAFFHTLRTHVLSAYDYLTR